MIKKFVKGKTAIFVDASNVYFSQKKYNKKCLVMAAKHSISIELIKCAKYINLNKLKNYIQKV